jgi:hypothetical protein
MWRESVYTWVLWSASSTYSAFHRRSPTRAVTGPVETHFFDVELATQSLSLFLANQINRNLDHLKRHRKTVSISLHTHYTLSVTWMTTSMNRQTM